MKTGDFSYSNKKKGKQFSDKKYRAYFPLFNWCFTECIMLSLPKAGSYAAVSLWPSNIKEKTEATNYQPSEQKNEANAQVAKLQFFLVPLEAGSKSETIHKISDVKIRNFKTLKLLFGVWYNIQPSMSYKGTSGSRKNDVDAKCTI